MQKSIVHRDRIYAHRGLWLDPLEKNSAEALGRASDLGFAVETDLVEVEGIGYVSHGMKDLDSAMRFDELDLRTPVAINLKSDDAWRVGVERADEIKVSGSFFFDGSGPVMKQVQDHSLPIANRVSEFELPMKLPAGKLWIDSFSGEPWWTPEQIREWSESFGQLIFVSPELHGHAQIKIWNSIVSHASVLLEVDFAICTDLPLVFEDFAKQALK